MISFVPQPPEWTDRAPVRFRASRELMATADEVWAALCDHERWPEWFGPISHVEPTGGDGLGSTRTITIAGRWPLDEEFNVWNEPRTWGFTVRQGAGPLALIAESLNERVTIQTLAPDRVRVTYLMAIGPRKGRTLVAKSLKSGTTKSLHGALKALGNHIEHTRTAS